MKNTITQIKTWAKQKALEIILFSYALGLGTSLSVVLSRCNTNCLNCASCSLYLGIIPVIAAVAFRNKIKKSWNRIFRCVSWVKKAASGNGYD